MARISYDDQTAAAFKAVREIPREGLGHWRDAVRRHLSPSPRMTVADIGAGTVEQICEAFATAGFRRDALEQVPETLTTPAGFLAQLDTFRRADTNMRSLTEEEFLRGKERLRLAHSPEPRTNWLDLLVLR